MHYRAFRRHFTNLVKQHSLWSHPWFTLVQSSPTITLLRLWAIQAGMIDGIFAEILGTLRANPLVLPSAHQAIERNHADELGHGDPAQEHFQLFQGVLGVLGVTRSSYARAPALTGTQIILNGLRNAVQGDPVRALAVMASEEFICPREFPILMKAIRQIGVAPGNAWEPYFVVHCEADVGHAADLIEQLYLACHGDHGLMNRAFACAREDLVWNVAFYDSLLLVHLEMRET